MSERKITTILITGGGGYVGSALVPALLKDGYTIRVVDTFWYGKHVFDDLKANPRLQLIERDIRDEKGVASDLNGVDAVIHLACISNDPSFELNPDLGRTVNFDAFQHLLTHAVDNGVQRFIYASSSSIYGIKSEPDVREDADPNPLTDYSKYKLKCEEVLLSGPGAGCMDRVIVRPATVCGYAPRMRLDLAVNILTIHALVNRKIRIFGGKQLRPNLHIADMVDAYRLFLTAPSDKIDGEAFNVGYQNRSIEAIAGIVKSTIGDDDIVLHVEPTDDNRSYHVNSDKIRKVLGFSAQHSIEDAVRSIVIALADGHITNPFTNTLYSNIKRMQELNVT